MFLKTLQNSPENNSAGVFFDEVVVRRPQACSFIKKQTPAQVEVYKI